MKFEWDERKNLTNKQKHGLSFEEASTAFFDDEAILFDDPEHSDGEERFLLIGMATSLRVCVVCHCYRDGDTTIRIISAREATKNEENRYAKGI